MALALNINMQGGYTLGLWKMDESVSELLNLVSLTPAEAELYQKFKAEHRQKEWLSVRAVLSSILDSYSEISYTENGKPTLLNSKKKISIAHTKGLAVVIISDVFEVGVDVEYLSDRIFRIEHKFIGEKERLSLVEGERLYHLYLHWCAKESIVKATGNRKLDFINELFVHPFIPESEGQFRAELNSPDESCGYVMNYLKYEDYIIVWTCQ
ncbi:MAG: hypothetical protein C0594_07925 [Marinilabiliales bacterium]|nr:MAG: hypothetical protein C0594_07925 [Marinilabiliales bacterium]